MTVRKFYPTYSPGYEFLISEEFRTFADPYIRKHGIGIGIYGRSSGITTTIFMTEDELDAIIVALVEQKLRLARDS